MAAAAPAVDWAGEGSGDGGRWREAGCSTAHGGTVLGGKVRLALGSRGPRAPCPSINCASAPLEAPKNSAKLAFSAAPSLPPPALKRAAPSFFCDAASVS